MYNLLHENIISKAAKISYYIVHKHNGVSVLVTLCETKRIYDIPENKPK